MGVIKYQKKENMAFEILPNGVKRAEMLPGMVEGVHTYKCQVKAGETVELEVFGDITQLIYITSGECYITTRDKAFMVTEPSLFIPNMDLEKNVLHAVTDVEYLQLTCEMLPMAYFSSKILPIKPVHPVYRRLPSRGNQSIFHSGYPLDHQNDDGGHHWKGTEQSRSTSP